MSPRDVDGDEMDGPHDFDDSTTEAFLRGTGREVDPRLADVIGDMQVAYTSTPPAVGAELAALIGAIEPVTAPQSRRFERMRSTIIAKIGAAAAAVVAATGGLAVAGALPAPVQDAMSHVGIGSPADHNKSGSHVGSPEDESTTTTSVGAGETTTVEGDGTTPTTNHGDDVAGVAHEHDGTGCEHGHDVADEASGGRSQGEPCSTTPTSVGDHLGHGDGSTDGSNDGGNEDGNHDGTPPTTVAGSTGGSHDGGSQDGGSQDGGSQDGGSQGGGGHDGGGN